MRYQTITQGTFASSAGSSYAIIKNAVVLGMVKMAGLETDLLSLCSTCTSLGIERAAGTMMERLKRLTQGKLSQSELTMLKGIYEIVTTQSWFDDTECSREGFAVGLVGLFRYGIVKPNQLQKIAMLWAYTEFSKDMPNAQRLKLKSLHSGCSVPE
ncbi:hypothetical protein [Rhizobium sp. AG207R]|uniref:hypothetical protein n=1 Tax=Rhizobium sp. AG207R TaxID=2802287 RepID=UPI0022ABE592|nr:hypothetical protein [Rhizobium sp. AG207R]MCZ3378183.1 hypothetical protein [Rhizobium sp. AG207R]